jgi:hypothetical protein
VASLGPGTKTLPKHNLLRRKTLHKTYQNNSKQTKNRLAAPRPKDTRVKQFTRGKSHKWHTPVRPVTRTGQTGQAWAARDEHHPQVNSPKSKPRSLESLHGLVQDFGGSRNTSWGVHSQVIVHQNLPTRGIEEILPRTPLTLEHRIPQIEPLNSRIWEGNQMEKNH